MNLMYLMVPCSNVHFTGIMGDLKYHKVELSFNRCFTVQSIVHKSGPASCMTGIKVPAFDCIQSCGSRSGIEIIIILVLLR